MKISGKSSILEIFLINYFLLIPIILLYAAWHLGKFNLNVICIRYHFGPTTDYKTYVSRGPRERPFERRVSCWRDVE